MAATVALGPTHLMDHQALLSQNVNLLTASIRPSFKVLALKFSLIFKHLLKGVVFLSMPVSSTATKLRRNIDDTWSTKLPLCIFGLL